ncbi:RelA/SpoT [Penicillium macrosclerotiorum]|uniref:RelA/SpoT n=1 Tax=Penicillium macrosclerotiorum TaxID=303699 RepID=UPI002547E357|nr:RelA/SpoT [Penicillium macrosclerotiorum]KAJ5688608.1 RelA/SpoT [Penicillium macrosclerotiorum]
MSAPSNLPDREGDDMTEFSNAHEVVEYFQTLLGSFENLRLTSKDLELEAGPSADALKWFLELTGRNNRVAFRRLVEETFKPRKYESLKMTYYGPPHFEGFTCGLYLIDMELLVDRNGIFASFDMPISTVEKIDIILSTIFWIDELDSSERWKMAFVSFDQGRLEEYLKLLWGTHMIRYFNNPQLGLPNELDKTVNQLWVWLDTHNQRPIKLVFSMARHGLMWNIQRKGQMRRLRFIIEDLDEAKNNLNKR